jgi:DNA-binding CsgD family transcriptional regulator
MRFHVPGSKLTDENTLQAGIRQACLELPDDTRQRLRRMADFLESPEWRAYWSAAKASMSGDEAPIRRWAEERTGCKPNPRLRVRLGGESLGDDTPAETWRVVRVNGARLKSKAKANSVRESVPEILAGIRRFGSVEWSLTTSALGGQTSEQVLRDMIPGLAYELKGSIPDTALTGEIVNQIRREATERSDARSTAMGLAAFADREALLKRGRDAGLPPREYELYKFFVDNPGATNVEAAQRLGVALGTVKSLKHRITNTPELLHCS